MKVGINSLFMIPNEVGGTEYHLRSFLKYLEKEDKQNLYLVFCNRENFNTFNFTSPRWKKINCRISARNRIVRILFEQLILPFVAFYHRLNLMHSFGYFGPIINFVQHIVTVHDTNWLDCPEDFSFLSRTILKFLTESSMIGAKRIITDSEFSKSRLINFFPKYKSKIEVIPGGIEDDFLFHLSKSKVNPLNKKFILYISAMYPHKNHLYLLDIWEEILKIDPSLNLVLIGQHGIYESLILKKIDKIKNIYYFPKVSYLKLVSFYKDAKIFISPSVYEGFGYTVYEAVAAGVLTFVYKKEMYDKLIQPFIEKLSGNAKKDAMRIKKAIDTNRRNNYQIGHKLTYKNPTLKLIKIYNSLAE